MCVFGGVEGPQKSSLGHVPTGVDDMTTTLREYNSVCVFTIRRRLQSAVQHAVGVPPNSQGTAAA